MRNVGRSAFSVQREDRTLNAQRSTWNPLSIWQRWWLARAPRQDTLELTHRNVYILPTRAGLMLAATLLVLLLASINYQLNLGYLLTFLLAGCALAGMHATHANLRALSLRLAPPAACFAGAHAQLRITLSNRRPAARHGIGLRLREHPGAWSWCDVPAQGSSVVELAVPMPQRGRQPLPTLTLETRFPLGIFRVWALWRGAAQVLVYPRPEAHPPPLPPGQAHGRGSALTPAADSGEFDGVRPYRPGDPRKLIVWKKAAKSEQLISRDSPAGSRQELWLDLAQAGSGSLEHKLSRLCAWVLEAERLGLDYGLRLPGVEIAPAQGEAHQRRCLEALASC